MEKLLRLSVFISLCLLCIPLVGLAQSASVNVMVTVLDSQTKDLLPYATVALTVKDKAAMAATTNDQGVAVIRSVPEGEYGISVIFLGLEEYKDSLSVRRTTSGEPVRVIVEMRHLSITMKEVVVTATESGGLTSSSVIKRQAMEHIQPSSIKDLMALVPGNSSLDPQLGQVNLITLREASGGTSRLSEYGTSYLGTQFMVDGVPMSADGDMQATQGMRGMMSGGNQAKNVSGVGIDTRQFSTDDIESVEVVRGIPSVEYGDLTTGMIKVERKKGVNALTARFKADVTSKLFYAGKGFELPKEWILNVSGDYLQSYSSPTNRYTSFNRLSFSARASKQWKKENYRLSYDVSADYRGTVDDMKTDPDLEANPSDFYKSDKNGITFSNTLEARFQRSLLQSLSLTASVSYDKDKVTQQSSIYAAAKDEVLERYEPAMVTGERVLTPLPAQYTGIGEVDGQPLYMYAKLMGVMAVNSDNMSNNIKFGGDWRFNKNFGKGYVSDTKKPLYPLSTMRGMPYDEIPATHNLALFVEDNLSLKIGRHQFRMAVGVRAMTMMNLQNIHADSYKYYGGDDPSRAPDYHYGDVNAKYRMNGKFYFDPRANVRWTFPGLPVAGRDLVVSLGGGVGQATKMPAMTHIYQDLYWHSQAQLTFTPAHNSANLMYYLCRTVDPTNYDLKPARNMKYEISADFEYAGNRLSVTGFVEDMKGGFRSDRQYLAIPYTYYVGESYEKNNRPGRIPASELTSPPPLDYFYSVADTVFTSVSKWMNASRTLKKGVEFQFSSKRIEAIRTRATVYGAWFLTEYTSSQPVQNRGDMTLSQSYYIQTPDYVGGDWDGTPSINVPRRVPLYGIYNRAPGQRNQSFNTNLILDTDIPKLDFGFSLAFECMWFTTNQQTYGDNLPELYVDYAGRVYDFKSAYAAGNVPRLDELDMKYTEQTMYYVRREPFEGVLNFKATKRFMDDRMTLALFVNRLAVYRPDKVSGGVRIARKDIIPPYFGMELNCRF